MARSVPGRGNAPGRHTCRPYVRPFGPSRTRNAVHIGNTYGGVKTPPYGAIDFFIQAIPEMVAHPMPGGGRNRPPYKPAQTCNDPQRCFLWDVGAACMRPAAMAGGTRSRCVAPIPLQCRAGVHARRGVLPWPGACRAAETSPGGIHAAPTTGRNAHHKPGTWQNARDTHGGVKTPPYVCGFFYVVAIPEMVARPTNRRKRATARNGVSCWM